VQLPVGKTIDLISTLDLDGRLFAEPRHGGGEDSPQIGLGQYRGFYLTNRRKPNPSAFRQKAGR
jgi:hypothetical protein